MVLKIICVFLLLCVLLYIMNLIEGVNKNNSKIEFKEGLDAINLPSISVQVGCKKLNFIIDTGCEASMISDATAKLLCIPTEYMGGTLSGIDSVKKDILSGTLDFSLKGCKYKHIFRVSSDLDNAFSVIKEEENMEIHGILGTDFFNTYNYIIDYKDYVLYKK